MKAWQFLSIMSLLFTILGTQPVYLREAILLIGLIVAIVAVLVCIYEEKQK